MNTLIGGTDKNKRTSIMKKYQTECSSTIALMSQRDMGSTSKEVNVFESIGIM